MFVALRRDLNCEECRLYAPPQTVYVVLEVEVRASWIENKYFINKSQTLSDTRRIVLGIMFHCYYLVNSIDGCFYVFHGMPKGDTTCFTLSFSKVNDNLASYFWVFHKVPHTRLHLWKCLTSYLLYMQFLTCCGMSFICGRVLHQTVPNQKHRADPQVSSSFQCRTNEPDFRWKPLYHSLSFLYWVNSCYHFIFLTLVLIFFLLIFTYFWKVPIKFDITNNIKIFAY